MEEEINEGGELILTETNGAVSSFYYYGQPDIAGGLTKLARDWEEFHSCCLILSMTLRHG